MVHDWSALPLAQIYGRSVRLWRDRDLRPPLAQILCDEKLLDGTQNDLAIIRLWQSQNTLAVSRQDARGPGYQQAVDHLAARGIAVVQRSTGGTAVVHTGGTLNVSLVYTCAPGEIFSIGASYRELVEPLIAYLGEQGIPAEMGEVPGAFCSGRYDVICNGGKLAGTAQRVKRIAGRSRVLSHYTLNVDNELAAADWLINRFYELSGSMKRVLPDRACSVSELRVESGQPRVSTRQFTDGYFEFLLRSQS